MTEENAAAFQREGEITFESESTDEETSADSQSENDNQEEDTQSDGGENSQNEKHIDLDKHPRWQQRETEWNDRFNTQEKRHQDDLKAIREEFGDARKTNAEQTKIPLWFGGTQEQWDAYRADRDAELKSAADQAVERLNKDRTDSSEAQQNAVAEATTYMKDEIKAIESDKVLNPSGSKIDQATAEKLLKTVLENELIDTKGRWNYKAGWKLLDRDITPGKKPNTSEKKDVAEATSSNNRGGKDANASTIATSESFKKDRPW